MAGVKWMLLPTLLATVMLTACYEEPDVTFYEPGVYKGREDPLLELQRSEKQQTTLRKRLELVQTDR